MNEILENLSQNYFPGLCEEYSPGSSHSRSSTRVRMRGILVAAREFQSYQLFIYNARFADFRVIVPIQLE